MYKRQISSSRLILAYASQGTGQNFKNITRNMRLQGLIDDYSKQITNKFMANKQITEIQRDIIIASISERILSIFKKSVVLAATNGVVN
jgi:hypothetical protein